MNTKIKKVLSGVLTAAVLLSMAGCGGSTTPAGDTTAANTTAPTQTTAEKTTNQTDAAVQEKVQEAAEDAKLDLKVEKKITWLAWWDMDETAAEVEMFKTLYGIPQEGDTSFGDDADHVFENISVAYGQRYDTLSTLVQSGDSPDIFPFEINNYPYSVYKGLFQSIDGVIDITGEEWNDMKDSMKKFEWGGKNYCPITTLGIASMLWYRRSIVEEAGLDDPYELYKKGEWNWNTFLDMCAQFSDPDSKKYCLDGYNPENSFVCTSGTPLIALSDGQLKSNLYDANVERAMDLISTMCTQNYRYPRHELNNWSTNYGAWANGDNLFFDDGTWRFEETWKKYRDKYSWGDDDIFFVPFPQDPNSDSYYQQMKNDCYMLVSGSDNVDGYKAWISCCITCYNDPDVKEAAREKRKKDYGWTDEQLDFLDEVNTTLTPVFDFKNGIGEDIAGSSVAENAIESLTKYPYVQGEQSYTQLRATNEGEINARLELINASVA